MNKYFSYILVAALVFAAAITSCKKDEEPTYTVSFNSKGGTPTPQEQTVKKGGKITKPADPTRANHTLAGWAKADNETSALWNFDSETVTEDMTLFARWSIVTHAVTFDSDGGSAVTAQNVAHGSTASKPADPTRSGHEFDGWFNGEAEWNFATAITAPVALKAKWTAVHTVTFDSDGGSAVPAQTIRNGNAATKPATDPTRDGYEFDGWFNGATEWNFTIAITAPITLTAKWTKVYIVTFDSDGGSAVATQTIRIGNKATKPSDPTKAWIAAAGLYLGTPPSDGNYTFGGWYNGETEWDFAADIIADITLKAKWTIDFSLTRIEPVPANDVPAAFTYANANSTGVEEYALLLDANVIIGEQSVNSANVNLTIIGIGVERFITVNSTNGRLFSIDGNNANLIIGRNVTLMGKSISSFNTHLIYIQRGTLIMRDGSKITGHRLVTTSSANVVSVEGVNAGFKLDGGEISGSDVLTAVNVSAGSTFEMSGGSIMNNSNNTYREDVFIDDANCTFLLSGTAKIGIIKLYANNNTTRSTVTIADSYSGTVTTLHLAGNNTNVSTAATFWTNAPVIINGTAGIISMFNNGGLGNFCGYYRTSTASIRATHELNAAGVLVLK